MQFMITGVLGPQSNAHGPNEFLHVPMGKKLTCCVAQVLGAHFERAKASAATSRPVGKSKSKQNKLWIAKKRSERNNLTKIRSQG